MDLGVIGRKGTEIVKKYRYPILVLLIGIVLMTLPQKRKTEPPVPPASAPSTVQTDITRDLTEILVQIKGVGKVKVMLTIAKGESNIYQSDENISTAEGGSSTIHKDTVIITDADRNQHPLITHVESPEYQGAIIVCQGADQPEVKLAIVEAVSKITGLGADRISVLKMK